jgi:flagellar biosynthesis protein FlhF
MRLKLYRASTMAAAMTRVRAELGADALILASRRVADGVEITAALEPETILPEPLAARQPDRERIAMLDFHAVPAALHAALQDGPLNTALARALSFGTLPLGTGEPPLLLVGPPGAGKTLTTARLATRLVMAGVTPMVITADGRRAGATEQLAAFTRLLGIDLTVASHPVTLGRALTRRHDEAPVLIDAPGGDPFDPAQADELRALAATSGAAIALVLPAGLHPEEAAELASAYADIGATLLIGTRLDLARRLGGLLAAASTARLAIAEAGIGPGAADGLVRLTPEELAARLLHAPARPRDPTADDPNTGRVGSVGDRTNAVRPSGERSPGGRAGRDPTVKVPAAWDRAARDPAARAPAASDTAARDHAAGGPSAWFPAAQNPAARNRIIDDPAARVPNAQGPDSRGPNTGTPTGTRETSTQNSGTPNSGTSKHGHHAA